MADRMSIDKKEESEESMASSPDIEHNQQAGNLAQTGYAGVVSASTTTDGGIPTTHEAQVPKRKGGRKPIYATSEERKQRNRQAQAAFRERRTEYIKQLEETIRVHESNLHNLQAAHRSAADECLMLRYKNSLLERILLEKGIDVQAELRAKTGSPTLGPTHIPQNLVQPPPIHRTILNRHQSRRPASTIAPKIEPGVSTFSPTVQPQSVVSSPKNQKTSSNQSHSPATTGTPTYGSQIANPASVATDAIGLRAPMGMKPIAMSSASRPTAMTSAPGLRSDGTEPFYPTPSFQNHMDQLEQEYDTQADIIEDPDAETPGPGPYPTTFAAESHLIAVSPTTSTATVTSIAPVPHIAPIGMGQSQTPLGQYPSMTQLLEPSLDWDPFGLSASMHFPTQFSFDTSNMR